MTPDEIDQLRAEKYNATVLRLLRVHPELLIMRVRSDFPRPAHKPGQYTVLGMGYWEPRHAGCQAEQLDPLMMPRLARRSYSISCSVVDPQGDLLDIDGTDWLEFYIVLVRNSGKEVAPALTPRLFLLEEGSRLYIGEKIAGHYTLEGVKPDD
jgi:ferredoxin--NADP+ reductase